MSAYKSSAAAHHRTAGVAVCVLALAAAAMASIALATAAPVQRASGDQLWASQFTPPGQLECRAVAAASAPDGSLYVAASSAATAAAPSDIVVLKYAPDGTLAWSQVIGGSGDDRPAALAIDGKANVVVAGTIHNATTGDDAYVVKYSPAGVRLWAASYRGPVGGADSATDVAADLRSGAVYVAATTSGIGGQKATVIRYSSTGHRSWARRYLGTAGPSAAAAIALDRAGNPYAGGSFTSHGDREGLVLAYSSSGMLRWTASATGARQRDSGILDVTVGQGTTGHVYACGSRGVALGSVAMLASYATRNGRHEWTTMLGTAGLGESTFRSVAAARNGNAVVAGDVAGTGSTGRQAVIAKYRVRTGATLWVQLYNATVTGDEDSLSSVAVNRFDEAFATGTSHTATGDQLLTLSYTGAGLFRWAHLYGGPAGAPAAGNALALNAVTGAPYAAGFAADTAGGIESAVVAYQR